jgi:hypothetical protein
MSDKRQQFDPTFIIYQIVAVQCFFYLIMGTLWGVIHSIFGFPVTLDNFFTPNYVNFTTLSGLLESVCMIVSGSLGSYLLMSVVERSKKCVDFTVTLYLIHVVLCWMYSQQFPLAWEWWVMNVISSVLMASLGEYLCSKHELEDIPLYSSSL